MHRWPGSLAATGLWAFVLTGLLGLLDAVVNASLHGLPGGPGLVRSLAAMLPAFTLYGWFGLVTATIVALPLLFVWRGRSDAGPLVPAQATAAALGVVVAIWIGYLVRETAAGVWWEAHLGPLWVPLLLAALGLALGMAVPLRRLLPVFGGGGRATLAVLVVIVVGASLLWPDGTVESRRERVGHLENGIAPAGAPSVLLVSIDALRRDRLSCTNPDAPPTPHLDGLAAEGRLFTNAFSVSGWTLPSMAAVMTGLPPRALDVSSGRGLPETVPTLAESAWRAGWWTSALVANPYLAEEFGFARGFADFDHTDVIETLGPARRTLLARQLNRFLVERTDLTDGRRLVALASRWLRDHDPDRPFFYWIHLMDPHMPYRAHPDPAGRPPTLPDHDLLETDRFDDTAGLRAALPDVPAEVLQTVEELYDGEVRHVDRCVGDLLAALAESGHADRTWILVLSDHGEEFFEHGGFEHGHSLLPEVSGVPLIIRPPGGLPAAERDDRPVSLLDLVPSLAPALGWSLPDSLPGKSCLLAPRPAPCTPAGLTVLENMLYGPPQQAVLRWPDLRLVELESGAITWFDLAADPLALVAVAAPADATAVRGRARELVARWRDRAEALGALDRADAELSDTARRRLRSLGY